MFSHRIPFGGSAVNQDNYPICVVQIDESLLRGKRKYNRGRLLSGDDPVPQEDVNEFIELSGSDDEENDHQRNYGRRITGPWIFGLSLCRIVEDDQQQSRNGQRHGPSYRTIETRLFCVEKRNRETLLPISQREVVAGSYIYSDQWAAYSNLGEHGFRHRAVNHSENFVDPVSNAHTQNIEREWEKLKGKLLRRMRGTSDRLRETHLNEFWYPSQLSGRDLLHALTCS